MTDDAVEILRRRYPEVTMKDLEEVRAQIYVAQLIYDARTAAGLSQRQLAKLVKTSPSVISRLESTNYGGHSLSMLRRVAAALNMTVTIQFVPVQAGHGRAGHG
jgi:ribosome-binding protein aMBF1 (putative translation factor)